MRTHLDEQVGRILAALRATGHERDTLVVFTADNGLALGSHGLLGKQNCYEHSLAVPLILRGPGVPAGRRSPALVPLQDLLPTLCELSRIGVPGGLDGRSFAGVIRRNETIWPTIRGRPPAWPPSWNVWPRCND